MENNIVDSDMLEYYLREINYLRDSGAIFAEDFPKIASRLNINKTETTDPHVERLIESFAFLTARIQKRIDNVAFDLTTALLDVLYPHLNKQLPAMTIGQFKINTGGSLPPQEGYPIARHTELFSYSTDDSICRFRTIYPITLFPLVIRDVQIVANNTYKFISVPNTVDFCYNRFKELDPYFLEIQLSCIDGQFSDLNLDQLLFYLNIADKQFKMQLYQAIFSAKSVMYCVRGDETIAYPMLPFAYRPMGLERDEMVIPPLAYETHAYQLLQEYFHFPEKFMFLLVQHLSYLKFLQQERFLNTAEIKLLIPLNGATSDWSKNINKHDVLLNCTPLVNLFSVITDPISFDHQKTFYHLIPDAQHDRTMEIYQIDDVFSVNVNDNSEKRLHPYFTFKCDEVDEEITYWWSKTEQTKHKNVIGTDTLISLVDSTFKPIDPYQHIIYAKVLCTNRFLAEDLLPNTELQIEAAAPVESIRCLQKPNAPQYCLEKGENNAKLIAQLSANYIGFPYMADGDVSEYLKHLLKTHVGSNDKKHIKAMLADIHHVSVTQIMKRVGKEAWKGMLNGVRIDIFLNKTEYIHDWFLLAQILQHYFAMNCQINTFVDLRLLEDNVEVIRFDGILGEQRFI